MNAPLSKLPARMPAERTRSRRERRSDAARRPVLHVVMPGLEVAREVPRKGETITAFLRRVGWASRDRKHGWQFRKHLPTILEINGEPLLRRHWSRKRIEANDNLRFVSYPMIGGQGGSGKQVLGLVALVAIAAFAGPLGGAFAGALGLTGTAATIAGGLATAAIGLGGALLVNALTAPKPGATNDPNATTDQIYSVQAQGNAAKLGQPLPVPYGRTKWYPDFAATPWGEFVGNDQYLNILLSVGMGSFDYEQMYISDTPFWNPTDGVSAAFSSAVIRFYEPGDTIDLFPINVSQSDEVTGQQLPVGAPGDYVGPFVAVPAAEDAYQLALDFVFPAGCFTTDDNGNTGAYSVDLQAEIQEVDDAGAPIGGPITQSAVTYTFSSRAPIRGTMLITLPSDGRYEVKLRRNNDVPEDNKGAADVVWAGLRAFLRGNNLFPDVSTIAIRIKATESTQGSYKFGVLATRKLPVWDGNNWVMQATRNPAWALYDAATNSQYGAGIAPSKIDFNAIVSHASGCDARGDTFDYNFTSAVAVPDAFDKILTVSRARHFWLGDTLSVVRDQWEDVPTMLLTDREIIRDSTQVTWTMLGENDPDAVVIEYVDETTWLPAQVQYPPESVDFTAANAETKRLDGIVNRDQAYRECAFYYLQSIYRRENVQIGCEYEGRAITFGQTIRVQSELPQNYGYAGAVLESTGTGGRTLTLSPVPAWADSGNFMRLRRPNGKYFGPVTVAKGDNDNVAILDATDLATVEGQQGTTLADVLARADGGEFPSFELGTADNQSKVVKVLTGQPNGDTFTLTLVVDDERVHATDLGNPPILPVGQFPANSDVPLLVGLNAKFDQGIAEPMLRASWFPTAGALYYVADVSYDAGQTWINVYEGADNKFEKVVTLAALTLRVQAVSAKLRGPYSSLSLDAPTIVISDDTVALRSLQEGVAYQVTQAFTTLEDRVADAEDILDLLANEVARNHIDKKTLRGQAFSLNDALKTQTFEIRDQLVNTIEVNKDAADAAINDVRTVAVGTQAAFASFVVTTTATIGSIQSQVTTTSSALSTLNGAFADYQVAVSAQFGATNASVTAESAARSSADVAIAGQITTINANLGTTNANLTAESYARATADTALTTTMTTLTSTVNANVAAISYEATTRASADMSISNTVATLTASVNGNAAAISTEATVRANADSAISGSITTLTSTVNATSAAVSSEAVTRASADSALSTTINSVSSTVGGHSASLSQVASSVNGSSIYLGLIGTIDGVTGGLVLTGVGQNGVVNYNLYLRGNFIVDGSITGAKIQAGSIDAISIAANSINVTHLQVNSVDITKLIQGAATQRTYYNFVSSVGFGNVIGGQQSGVSILSGAASVTFSGSLASTNGSGGAAANTITLYVDGVAASPGFAFSGAASGAWSWTATGLSAGNHTFDWRIFSDFSNTQGSFGQGQTVVVDLRR